MDVTLDVDLNLGDLLAGLAALVAVAITLWTTLNSRTRLYKVAQRSMELAKALKDQANDLPPNTPIRNRALGLHRELAAQSHYASQQYVVKTTPKALTLIEAAGRTLLVLLFAFIAWTFPGAPAEWDATRNVVGWLLIVVAFIVVIRGANASKTASIVALELKEKAAYYVEDDSESSSWSLGSLLRGLGRRKGSK